MAWVNLNDVYVNKTGGTITGDLTVNGSIKVNDGKGDGGIYNVANEITTLRNSVSHGELITLYGSSDAESYIRIQRVGNMCILRWDVTQETANYWALNHVVPEELRPSEAIYTPSCVTNSAGYVLNVCAYGYVNSAGSIGFQVAAATTGAINRGICSWRIS